MSDDADDDADKDSVANSDETQGIARDETPERILAVIGALFFGFVVFIGTVFLPGVAESNDTLASPSTAQDVWSVGSPVVIVVSAVAGVSALLYAAMPSSNSRQLAIVTTLTAVALLVLLLVVVSIA